MRKWSQLAVLTTCVLTASVIGALVVSSNLLAEAPPDLSRYVLTKPQTLFSVSYGKGLSQVGMSIPHPTAEDGGEAFGPSDFAIGFDGSIYIGDEVNGKVKRFSRKGKLLMVTEGCIDRIAGMAVDKQGRIYIIHGTLSNKVAVYDEKGRRLPDVESKIMKAAERLSEELGSTQPELKETIFRGWEGLPAGAVKCDADGNLYFLIGIRFTVKVDANFKRAQVVKGYPYPLGGADFRYAYRLLPSQKQVERLVYGTDGSLVNQFLTNILQRAEVTIYRADGSVVRRFTLPEGKWSEVEKLVPVSSGRVICDGRGHFYTLRSPIVIRHIPLKPDNHRFYVVHFYAVIEYDDKGNFVGARAIINRFRMFSDWFKVDSQGNLYWLDFKADHLDVMMAPVPQ